MRRRPDIADERGFTLTELLVAMFVGMIVLLAAFMVLDRSYTASGDIADRSDALQRGRQTMEIMTRQLRSQVCLGSLSDPITAANANSITFYADLSDGTQPIKRRTLTYNPATKVMTESVVTGTGTYPNLSFNGAPVVRTLLTRVEPIMDGATPRPIFRYYGYKVGGSPGELEPLSAPLSTANLSRVAVIKVGFRSFPDRAISDDDNSTSLENDVYLRVAVPTQLEDGPECI